MKKINKILLLSLCVFAAASVYATGKKLIIHTCSADFFKTSIEDLIKKINIVRSRVPCDDYEGFEAIQALKQEVLKMESDWDKEADELSDNGASYEQIWPYLSPYYEKIKEFFPDAVFYIGNKSN